MDTTVGAQILDGQRCFFRVWAPLAGQVDLVLLTPERLALPMQAEADGYYSLMVDRVEAGAEYFYRLDGGDERPDPASRAQPNGVHGASQVVDMSFAWIDVDWRGIPLDEYVFYELHVGTFTAEGTFEAVIPHLDRLKDLGITAIELMPVAQFPGGRNWGYDGVQPYAVQSSYGGIPGLKKLVDACHARGLAVVLDVVYNHLGPEGNYLSLFAPYFTDRYKSPWGSSINFDGADSDHVRQYFIDNALYWLRDFHVDALRLDATHGYFDFAAVPFIKELAESVAEWRDESGRQIYLIAENDRSDVRLVRPLAEGGDGIDSQWLDDLHHCLHVHLTGDASGYYADFVDPLPKLAKCLREGFVFSGDYSPFRRRRHGTSSRDLPGVSFVVSAQNHDQVGNRMIGERLSTLTDLDGMKLAAGIVLLSPYLPLIFMGEEYGEIAPFLFFTEFSDEPLIEAVRKGRAEEFAYFAHQGTPPDPHAESTFLASKLDHGLRTHGEHAELYAHYKALLDLRKTIPALRNFSKDGIEVTLDGSVLTLQRRTPNSAIVALFNMHLTDSATRPDFPDGTWHKRFASNSGIDAPESVVDQAPASITLLPKSFIVYESSRQHD